MEFFLIPYVCTWLISINTNMLKILYIYFKNTFLNRRSFQKKIFFFFYLIHYFHSFITFINYSIHYFHSFLKSKIMGNRISRLKRGRRSATTKKIQPKLDPDQEGELGHYLSNNSDSIDRAHMYHFFKRHLFQSNFSSPIENKLLGGKCKVLDIG